MDINTEELKSNVVIDEKRLAEIAKGILLDYYDEEPDFCLTFVEAARMQELNRQWRGIDSVTDVLSFEADGECDPETGLEYLGDIIICPEQAEKQAMQSGHDIQEEIALLEIHGLLHLLGYDHLDDKQREEMWEYQNQYLKKFDVKLNRRPGEDFDF